MIANFLLKALENKYYDSLHAAVCIFKSTVGQKSHATQRDLPWRVLYFGLQLFTPWIRVCLHVNHDMCVSCRKPDFKLCTKEMILFHYLKSIPGAFECFNARLQSFNSCENSLPSS